jgi:hypothetical protein
LVAEETTVSVMENGVLQREYIAAVIASEAK